MLDLISNHWLPLTVVIFIVVLIVYFYRSYFLPARKLKVDLQHAIDGVKSAKANTNNGIIYTEQIKHSFSHDEDLLHLWSEYTETVHPQFNEDASRSLKALRATVPAETFFNTAVIVDTKLNTEFFKHLPGLLTGIGIIGTFTGLLIGLHGFSPDTTDVTKLSAGLKDLMGGVQEAFVASALAITAAMVVTFFEKRILNSRYKQVEELAQAVDALYDAGAGEEYLRELVESSQQNQAHTAQLKDAMVNDLKTMLENLGQTIAAGFNKTMQEQMEQLLRGQEETNKQLVIAIQEGMKEPLDKVEKAITQLAGKQEEGVGELIGVAVKRIESMFGEKLNHFGVLLNQASDVMAQTVPQITEAGYNMQSAGDKMLGAGAAIESAGAAAASSITLTSDQFSLSATKFDASAMKVIQATDGLILISEASQQAAITMKSTLDGLGAIKESLEKLSALLSISTTDYQSNSDQLRQTFSSLSGVADKIEAVSKSLVETSEHFMSTQQTVNEASNAINLNLHQTNTKVESSNDMLSSLVNTMEELVKQSQEAGTSIAEVKDVFSGLKSTVEGLSTNAAAGGQSFQQGAKNIEAVLEQLNQTAETVAGTASTMNMQMSNVLTEIVSLAKSVEKSTNRMESILINGASSMNTAGQSIKNSADQAAKLISASGSSIKTAADGAASSLTNAGILLSENLTDSAAGIQDAAAEFNQSATDWKTISSEIKSASGLLKEATGGLQTATGTVQGYLKDYAKQNENVADLIEQVTDLVGEAETRGELGQKQVQQMTELVAQMQRAQQEAAKFGEQVGTALAQGYGSFAKETKEAIVQVTHDHQITMNEAVKLIKDNVSELDETLSKIVQVANSRV